MEKFINKNKKILITIIAIIAVVLFVLNHLYGGEGRFVETGSMTIPRIAHAATLLNDGRVLITGGYCVDTYGHIVKNSSKTAEIYDPKTGKFSLTGNMNLGRAYHTSTLLNDGRVFIFGGSGKSRAELYDSKTGKFTLTSKNTLKPINAYTVRHFALVMKDSKLLIVCARAYRGGTWLEIYDPRTSKFNLIGKTNLYHASQQAVLLPDGKVLIVGGFKRQQAELYDPITNKFTLTGETMGTFNDFIATLLNNNKVLLIGYHNIIDLYDIKTGIFTASRSTIKGKCGSGCTATLLKNGKVLILGANRGKQELYDPVRDKFVDTKRVKLSSFWHTATLLNNGDVLITGGSKRRGWWNVASSNKAMLYKY
jgi:WD40 repeat protein